jgi:polyphenol oxidase
MILETIELPPEARGIIGLRFPRTDGDGPSTAGAAAVGAAAVGAAAVGAAGEALALLSTASEGDMKYGDPACAPNRARALSAAGADPGRALGLALAHSRNVLFPADAEEHAALAAAAAGSGGGADGIVLRGSALVATVTVADCMPIWVLDRDSGAFGVLHSGWKGTGILAAAVAGIARRFGSAASSISAILGPAIGSCCYEVPAERARAFAREFGDEAAFSEGGAWKIDLRAANLGLARSLGLGALLSVDACTSCDERLGSCRRQGPASFTRMLAACGRFPLVHPLGG